jgi:hypothetical protein
MKNPSQGMVLLVLRNRRNTLRLQPRREKRGDLKTTLHILLLKAPKSTMEKKLLRAKKHRRFPKILW